MNFGTAGCKEEAIVFDYVNYKRNSIVDHVEEIEGEEYINIIMATKGDKLIAVPNNSLIQIKRIGNSSSPAGDKDGRPPMLYLKVGGVLINADNIVNDKEFNGVLIEERERWSLFCSKKILDERYDEYIDNCSKAEDDVTAAVIGSPRIFIEYVWYSGAVYKSASLAREYGLPLSKQICTMIAYLRMGMDIYKEKNKELIRYKIDRKKRDKVF